MEHTNSIDSNGSDDDDDNSGSSNNEESNFSISQGNVLQCAAAVVAAAASHQVTLNSNKHALHSRTINLCVKCVLLLIAAE